jgi:hypothetical protein
MRSFSEFRDYQKAAFEFAVERGRCYIAAKAGSGKTAIALAVIVELMLERFEVGKVLVVAPMRVASQWPQEAARWHQSNDLIFNVYPRHLKRSLRGETHRAVKAHVDVVQFEHLADLMSTFKRKSDWPYGLVIFDEASRLRKGGRRGSKTWKIINTIGVKTDSRIMLLSGSPRPGTAHELYGPVHILDQGQRLGKTLADFRASYLQPNKVNRSNGQVFSWKLRPFMEEQLYGQIQDLYFGINPDLGLKFTYTEKWVDFRYPGYQRLRNDLVLSSPRITCSTPASLLNKLRQMEQGQVYDDDGCSHTIHREKFEELQELIEQIDSPTIVCYWFEHDKDLLLSLPGAVDISTAQGLRDALSGKVDLAIMHPGSLGHGVDGLQNRFSAMIYYTLPESFELLDQSRRRIIRSGQNQTVSVFAIMAGEQDERVSRELARKESEELRFFEYLEKNTP